MTTVTEQAVEAIEAATQIIDEAVEVIAEVEHAQWKGNIVNHKLSTRASTIAASLQPLSAVTEKGISANRKDYYNVAEQHGFDPKIIKDVEEFNSDYAHAFHALASDAAVTRFRDDVKAEEFSARAEIGERSRYSDNYKRHYERSVATGAPGSDAPRAMKADYAYHSPSIKTEYKGLNESRKAVHNLAKDLLG